MTTALTPQARQTAVAWLETKAPAEVDKAVLSRTLSCGLALHPTYHRSGNGTIPAGTPSGFELSVNPEMDRDDVIRNALAAIDTASLPANDDRIMELLTRLSVVTAKRQGDHAEERLRASAYMDILRSYPADVAVQALTSHKWRFWPTEVDIREVCDLLALPRKLMRNAILHKSGRSAATVEQKLGARVTADLAAKIRADVEAKYAEAAQ